MVNEEYSSHLALEIPGKGYVPIPEEMVKRYNLEPGRRAHFTGYKVVARNPEWELKRCPYCDTDLFVPTDGVCPFCRASFRPSFTFP
jgi:hypothetical protein